MQREEAVSKFNEELREVEQLERDQKRKEESRRLAEEKEQLYKVFQCANFLLHYIMLSI